MSRVVIVAGASEGVGSNIVKTFDERTTRIYLIARSEEKLLKVSQALKESEAIVKSCDLIKQDELNQLFQDVTFQDAEEVILINCAATWTGGESIKGTTANCMRNSIESNFMTAFNTISLVLNKRKNGQLTKIINLGATASVRGGANTASFSVAKSALRTLTQSLARELGEDNVHATHIIIDGLILNQRTINLNPNLQEKKYIKMESIIKVVHFLIDQPKDCWTLELDLRPHCEKF